MNPTNEQELREQVANIIVKDLPYDEKLDEFMQLITAHTNAEIAKVLKTILKSYPKKNRTMNDTSKLTRADIDRMITELKERDDE